MPGSCRSTIHKCNIAPVLQAGTGASWRLRLTDRRYSPLEPDAKRRDLIQFWCPSGRSSNTIHQRTLRRPAEPSASTRWSHGQARPRVWKVHCDAHALRDSIDHYSTHLTDRARRYVREKRRPEARAASQRTSSSLASFLVFLERRRQSLGHLNCCARPAESLRRPSASCSNHRAVFLYERVRWRVAYRYARDGRSRVSAATHVQLSPCSASPV